MQKRIKKVIKIESVNETIMNYENVTRYFMDFIGEEFDIYDITSTDVDNYIADCLERTICLSRPVG